MAHVLYVAIEGYIFLFAGSMLHFFFSIVLNDVLSFEYDVTLKQNITDLVNVFLGFFQSMDHKNAFHQLHSMHDDADPEWGSEGESQRPEVGEIYGDPSLVEEFNAASAIDETDTFIVGCGPSGLVLSIELGTRGTNVIAVDKRAEVVADSRFFNICKNSNKRLLQAILSLACTDFDHSALPPNEITTMMISVLHYLILM
jgi:hypothetical protein